MNEIPREPTYCEISHICRCDFNRVLLVKVLTDFFIGPFMNSQKTKIVSHQLFLQRFQRKCAFAKTLLVRKQ